MSPENKIKLSCFAILGLSGITLVVATIALGEYLGKYPMDVHFVPGANPEIYVHQILPGGHRAVQIYLERIYGYRCSNSGCKNEVEFDLGQ